MGGQGMETTMNLGEAETLFTKTDPWSPTEVRPGVQETPKLSLCHKFELIMVNIVIVYTQTCDIICLRNKRAYLF